MSILLFLCIIFIAAILQSSTGFGFSVFATPFLLLILAPKEAIQINLVLSLVISFSLIRAIKADLALALLRRLSIGSILGVPLGIIIFISIDLYFFKIVISLLLAILTLLLLCQFKVNASPSKDYGAGLFSGLLTTSIGMPGPPLLLYFTGIKIHKATLRATTLIYFIFISLLSLLIQIVVAGTSNTVWLYSLYGLPAVVIGLYVGQLIFTKISQQVFRIFTYCLLSFTAIYLFVDTVFL